MVILILEAIEEMDTMILLKLVENNSKIITIGYICSSQIEINKTREKAVTI